MTPLPERSKATLSLAISFKSSVEVAAETLVKGVPVVEPLTEDEAVVEDPFALLPPLFSAFFANLAAFDAEIATIM